MTTYPFQFQRGLWVPPAAAGGGGPVLPELPLAQLVGWWSLNNTLADKLGKTLTNNNSVSLGSPGNGPGGVGQACVFDRTLSQYLSRAHEAALAISGDMTVCFWVYPTYMSTDIGIIDKNNQYAVTYDSALSGYPRTWLLGTGYQDTVDNSNDWTINTWQHYWMRHDATANTVELSTNDNAETTIASVTNSPTGAGTAALEFGRFFGTNYFSGRLCEVAIFTGLLSDAQLTSIYGAAARKTHTDFSWV